jgi:hypothetical protein
MIRTGPSTDGRMALRMRKLRLVVLASYLAPRDGVIKSCGEPKFVIPYTLRKSPQLAA